MKILTWTTRDDDSSTDEASMSVSQKKGKSGAKRISDNIAAHELLLPDQPCQRICGRFQAEGTCKPEASIKEQQTALLERLLCCSGIAHGNPGEGRGKGGGGGVNHMQAPVGSGTLASSVAGMHNKWQPVGLQSSICSNISVVCCSTAMSSL